MCPPFQWVQSSLDALLVLYILWVYICIFGIVPWREEYNHEWKERKLSLKCWYQSDFEHLLKICKIFIHLNCILSKKTSFITYKHSVTCLEAFLSMMNIRLLSLFDLPVCLYIFLVFVNEKKPPFLTNRFMEQTLWPNSTTSTKQAKKLDNH